MDSTELPFIKPFDMKKQMAGLTTNRKERQEYLYKIGLIDKIQIEMTPDDEQKYNDSKQFYFETVSELSNDKNISDTEIKSLKDKWDNNYTEALEEIKKIKNF